MPSETDDLKKLSPKERIEKLKKLQEKNKKEIEDAQKLLKEAEEEATIEDELREIPIPQLKAVDINELFSPEEKALFKTKRFEAEKQKKEEAAEEKEKSRLEEITSHTRKLRAEQEQQNIQYIRELSQRPVEYLLGRAAELYSQFKEQGSLTRNQQEEFNNIEYANRAKLEDIEAGRYANISSEVAREMVQIEKMRKTMQYIR